ncbi:MAG: hypothetical protein ACE1ZE_06610 [Candidatus Binatia bacterium]
MREEGKDGFYSLLLQFRREFRQTLRVVFLHKRNQFLPRQAAQIP